MTNIPYGRQKIDRDDIEAVIDVLKSDWITQGPKVKEFEQALAKYCNSKYAIAVSSGTSALHLAYLAADLKTSDEVITTPNTFVATSNMILAVGAKPVFCDIRLDTYNIDENKIEKYINKKTKAIVPVHFAGHPCEMDKILRLAKKYKLLVIEDASHALGAEYKNRKIGSLGDLTVFSFHPVKSITTGEGGAILTNNKDFYDKLILLRSHGIMKDKDGFNVMTKLGYNYRLTDIQAVLGWSQLKKLDKFIELRHKVASWYDQESDNVQKIISPAESTNSRSAWHIYVIRTKNPETRDGLAKYLKNNGIEVSFHYPAVYNHPFYQKLGYKDLNLPNENIYHKSCITLPLHTHLKKNDIKLISSLIKKFYAQ